ncbi:MAG: hypothetical protein MUO22_04010 [Sedimentisphaerales bacterium]|jgi:hypothetical protein|nr:hypothetical protein [Sedimentisphaerales bacterium]
MEIKLDVKTLVVGIVLGIVLTISLGAVGGSADKTDFGIAIPNQGFALVQTTNGNFYVVDAERATSELVEDKSKGSRGGAFTINSPARATRDR